MSFYNKFFNFQEVPFKLTPDPFYFYLSSSHEEAIELIEYAISEKKGFIALIGEVGTGKTTLTRVLLNNLQNTETSLVLNPFLNPDEILRYICKDFGLEIDEPFDKGKIYEKLTNFLLKLHDENKNALVIIDEAQNLSFESLEMLRQLSNIEKEDEKLLQIMFVGQPEFLEKLNLQEYRQLKQRISLIINLKQMTKEDTAHYIQHRVQKASKFYKKIFTNEAINLIYTVTGGNPREINKICEFSLIAAYNDKSKKVKKNHVELALKELQPVLLKKTENKDKSLKSFLTLIILSVIAMILGVLILSSKKENIITVNKDIKKQVNKKMALPKNTKKQKEEINKKCVKFLVNQKLRKAPNIDSDYIFIIPAGKVANLIQKSGDWAKISIDNQIGWILLYPKYNTIDICGEQ